MAKAHPCEAISHRWLEPAKRNEGRREGGCTREAMAGQLSFCFLRYYATTATTLTSTRARRCPPPATPSPSSSTTCLAFARLSLLKSETEAKHLKRYIIDGQLMINQASTGACLVDHQFATYYLCVFQPWLFWYYFLSTSPSQGVFSTTLHRISRIRRWYTSRTYSTDLCCGLAI